MAGHPPGAPPPPTMMPPPPPPPPPPGWQPSKPTSGKATAALICGLAGPIAAFMCPPLGLAVVVGLVLGIFGIVETGKNGTRAGRGLAIAGTIVSAGSIVLSIALMVGFFALASVENEKQQERMTRSLDEDQSMLVKRLQQYCVANNDSLGPGGPVLARSHSTLPPGTSRTTNDRQPQALVVTGRLEVSHLADDDELEMGPRKYGNGGWELIIEGQSTATLRAYDWNGEVIRELVIRDACKGIFDQTLP